MRAKVILAVCVGILPFRALRRLAYGLFPGYRIAGSARIGWMTVLCVDSLQMDSGSSIGNRTRVRGPLRVALGPGARLGARCCVECGDWSSDDSADPPYRREFILESDVMVTAGHYFDAIGGIRVGEGTWVAGLGTQVWTHGLGVTDREVVIGRYCYIGSAARFAPGARLGDLCVLALGAVVADDLSGVRAALLGGVPAKPIVAPYRATGWGALNAALARGAISYEATGEVETRER